MHYEAFECEAFLSIVPLMVTTHTEPAKPETASGTATPETYWIEKYSTQGAAAATATSNVNTAIRTWRPRWKAPTKTNKDIGRSTKNITETR